MGARIEIRLANLLSNPGVRVNLSSVVQDDQDVAYGHEPLENTARVFFAPFDENGVEFAFDYSSSPDGIVLGTDFNFFRDPLRHAGLMRALFEASVPFTVYP